MMMTVFFKLRLPLSVFQLKHELILDSIYFSDSGEVVYEKTVPDTITSWVTSAFAISDHSGLGVAPSTAKVFD